MAEAAPFHWLREPIGKNAIYALSVFLSFSFNHCCEFRLEFGLEMAPAD